MPPRREWVTCHALGLWPLVPSLPAGVAPPDVLYAQPAHPYSYLLLEAIPVPDPDGFSPTAAEVIGEPPSPVAPPSGCRFRTRCPRAAEVCATTEPQIRAIAPGHYVACHFPLTPGEDPASTPVMGPDSS